MSNPTDATVSTLITEESNEQTVEKVTFVQKAKTFVKNHKKSTIAVGALVGLVGLAAVTGPKKTDSTLELMPSEEYEPVLSEPTQEDVVILSQES